MRKYSTKTIIDAVDEGLINVLINCVATATREGLDELCLFYRRTGEQNIWQATLTAFGTAAIDEAEANGFTYVCTLYPFHIKEAFSEIADQCSEKFAGISDLNFNDLTFNMDRNEILDFMKTHPNIIPYSIFVREHWQRLLMEFLIDWIYENYNP